MPVMLTDQELERIREDMEDQLPATCVILVGTSSPDGMGGQAVTWGTLLNNVPCRLTQKDGREQAAGGGMHWYTRNLLTLPHQIPLTPGHRVVYAGTTYAVTNVTVGSLLGIKQAILERV